MKLLLTAFEPFGNDTINSAMETIKLVGDEIAGATIVKKYLPVVFDKAGELLRDTILNEKPDVVLCIGQAAGRSEITPEVIAINLQDSIAQDNEGNCPCEQKCIPDGKNAYFSNLPNKKIVEAIKSKNISSRLSYSAGTYVCNDVMYTLMYYIENEFPNIVGGFIHVPILNTQVKENTIPSMSIDQIVAGIEIAINTIIKNL